MHLHTSDHYSIAGEVLSQEVNGETVLLDLNGESYFGLNEVGTRIWQLLKAEKPVGEILVVLEDEYDASREQLGQDLGKLLEQLLDKGLVKLADR